MIVHMENMKNSYQLSICIPSRNEEFLGRTIQDLLEHTSETTEIIAILDGYLPNPPLPTSSRVTVIYNPVSVGQREGVNQAVKLSKAKYVLKLDAHCAVDENFDTKMIKAMEELGDDTTLIPAMRNMHIFDWVCPDGHRRYQSPSGVCENCGKPTTKDIVWIPKKSPTTFTFRFDKTMHFQYFSELAKRPENIKGTLKLDGTYDTNYRETMSIQGSCFMSTREKYLELGLCGEEFHSWGQQGVEVACKTLLSGGRVIANLYTWHAHTFRTRGGDFGFPYPNPQNLVNENRELSRELFQKDKWPLATRKFQWLLDKFNPPDWGISKGAIFYTPNDLDEKLAKPIRDQILKATKDKNISIVSSSLKKMDFGMKNVRFPSLKKGHATMFKQILGALENSKDDVVFFLEHDVYYSPSHFDFMPEDKNIFYFNNNVWKVDLESGKAVKVDKCEQLSGMCVYRETALKWVREKYKQIQTDGFDRHFEPQQMVRSGWESQQPNIDIRHSGTQTPSRWSKEEFRNQENTKGWTEAENEIPGWGDIRPILDLMR